MIAAGFGFRSTATEASLADALRAAAPGAPITNIATAAAKSSAAAITRLAQTRGLTVTAIEAGTLASQPTLTQSQASQAAHATGSVAEAAALAAAGPGARLLAPRAISADRLATCALAIGAPK